MLLPQTFTSQHFTTHIYLSHYAPLSSLSYIALHFTLLNFTTLLDDFYFTSFHFTTLLNDFFFTSLHFTTLLDDFQHIYYFHFFNSPH